MNGHGNQVSIRRIEPVTMGEQVYSDLKGLLMTGAFEPGSKLSLRPLAKQFGTSSMPVRDAMRRLAAEGGLRLTRERGFEVPFYGPEEFERLMALRADIESIAISHAGNHMGQAGQLAPLWELALSFERESRKAAPDGKLLQKINKDLHFALYGLCQEQFLIDTIERLWMMVGPTVSLYFQAQAKPAELARANKHHRVIIEALEEGDFTAAMAALKRDILEGAAVIVECGDFAK